MSSEVQGLSIEEFERALKNLELTKTDFAKKVGMAYTAVVNWNLKGHTPKWVKSWLENYQKARNFEKIKDAINLQNLF